MAKLKVALGVMGCVTSPPMDDTALPAPQAVAELLPAAARAEVQQRLMELRNVPVMLPAFCIVCTRVPAPYNAGG